MFLHVAPLQAAPSSPAAVAGTFASLALFLTLTAHIAARNVLGDVAIRNAFLVGPIPAAIALVFTTFSLPSAVAIALALVADVVLFKTLYGQQTRLAVYITFIHVVVSILLGVVLFGVVFFAASLPG